MLRYDLSVDSWGTQSDASGFFIRECHVILYRGPCVNVDWAHCG